MLLLQMNKITEQMNEIDFSSIKSSNLLEIFTNILKKDADTTAKIAFSLLRMAIIAKLTGNKLVIIDDNQMSQVKLPALEELDKMSDKLKKGIIDILKGN